MKFNIYKYLTIAAVCGAAALFASCGDDNITYRDVDAYLKLSTYSHMFFAENDSSITVKVQSTSDWNYTLADDSWVRFEEKGYDFVTFAVGANESSSSRSEYITFANTQGIVTTLALSQLGTKRQGEASYFMSSSSLPIIMSVKGKYVAYIEEGLIDYTYTYNPVIVDLESNELTTLPTLYDPYSVGAVSDEGLLVLNSDAGHTIYYKDGQYHTLDVPAGYTGVQVEAISSDGTIMYGALINGWESADPAKWENGQLTKLDTPEYDLDGETPLNHVYVRGCSADGSIAYGTTWNLPFFMVVYWDSENKMKYVAEDTIRLDEVSFESWGEIYNMTLYSGPSLTASNTNMSIDGNLIAYNYMDCELTEDLELSFTFTPTFYDLREQKVIHSVDNEGSALAITNNGTGFYGTPFEGVAEGFSYNTATGSSLPAAEWIRSVMGISIPSESVIIRVGENNRSVLGFERIYIEYFPIYKYWYINNF